MDIEQFRGEIPVERLREELVGRDVTFELLSIDQSRFAQPTNQERFDERYPNRHDAGEEEVRDFTAVNYTPLLEVWNFGAAGVEPRPTVGVEDTISAASRILSARLRVTGITAVQESRNGESVSTLKIDNSQGINLTLPRQHPLGKEALALTILKNPFTGRKECGIRLYGVLLVLVVET